MKIYLDFDGTLLNKQTGEVARGLHEFLEFILANHSVYWLTSHCRGYVEHLNHYLDRYVGDDELRQLLHGIKPTNWDALKTDAIDFDSPFIWLDDYILEAEKKVLTRNYAPNSWIKTDLKNNPDSLVKILDLITTLDSVYSPRPHSN